MSEGMARKLRIEYAGAIYHVINRGNYRRDVFETPGAAQAFVETLSEAVSRHRWRLHAYVVMRNHFHLAVQTPLPNLADGMHWLQSTFASRFNRFRAERGHLFQGRYQAILVENPTALGRVVDYIHLNPVRSGVVTPEHVIAFRWSSLRRFVKGLRFAGLEASDWLAARGGWRDDAPGWTNYETHLVALAVDEAEHKRLGFDEMSRGWSIGTAGWRQALAKDYAALALTPGIQSDEARGFKEARWEAHLVDFLAEAGHAIEEAETTAKSSAWKVDLAFRLHRELGAAVPWIAAKLHMGKPSSVRCYLSKAYANHKK